MADNLKYSRDDGKLAKSFKERLDNLGCPFTEGVDESWVLELIFKPGEPRIRLLQWLFARFDFQLKELLDPQLAPVETKMDSRIQRLLYVSSTIGLCRNDDVDLIRGITTGSKQTTFMDELVDLACIKETSEDPRVKIFQSPGVVCEASNLSDQFSADCNYVDQLVLEEKMTNLFQHSVNLIPHDIKKTIEKKMAESGIDKPTTPDVQQLVNQADQLTSTLERQLITLQELSNAFKYSVCDPSILSTTNRTMQIVLSELSQVGISFTYCYENEMRMWCNKDAPVLTNLGVAFKRVHNVLKIFIEFFASLDRIRQSYTNLGQKADKTSTKSDLVQKGQMALENFQECVCILEESLQRQEITSTSLTSSKMPS